MDHAANSGHQQRQEVSSCAVLCHRQGGGQDTDQPYHSNLVGPCEGPMQEQSPKIKSQVTSVSKKAKKPSDSNKNISLSGPTYPPKVKYSLTAPAHPPNMNYLQMVMEKQQQDKTSQPNSQRRHHRGKPHHREEEDQPGAQSINSHSCQSAQLAGATHPPKVTYSHDHNNCYCSFHSRTTTPS